MVDILEYQKRWPAEFKEIAATLRAGLGDLALRIDHIGSTAVPGLAGKDVIDVQITVAAFDDEVISAISGIGYVYRERIVRDHVPPGFDGPDSAWEKRYFRSPPEWRRTHIHVRAEGRANQRYALLFRDFLRAHPPTAAAYAELKRRLAAHLADPTTYPDVKDPAVDLITFAAEAWAAADGWRIGRSDG